jgi:MYXO-CTERM domain-containing protein
VTGVGLEPPLTPHHRPSAADGVKDPFPGLLVGGGSKVANWVDEQANYEVNEVAINWNASLVYALGVFLSAQGSSDGDDGGLAPADVEVAPEPPSTRPGGCGCVLEGAPGDLPGLGVTAVAVGAAFFLRRNRRPPAAH